MRLSVPCTFAPGLIDALSRYSSVAEVYGRRENGWIGGGRTSYTLRHASRESLAATVSKCASKRIDFNYLLNAASLYGLEQTRGGQRKIRSTLDALSELAVPWLTISLPYLLRLVKARYPHFKIKAGAFAQIDSPEKARRWEALGADALCVSAISCNRDAATLAAIREAVTCDLQLIANAACIPSCIYEHTHMDLLSASSRKDTSLGGFCLDYCFLHCSALRIREPEYFMRSVWIRPEDLRRYEALGYSSFKIVERSCPTPLLLRRVEAYHRRSFEGNLWELIAPVAHTPDKGSTPFAIKARALLTMTKPWYANMRGLLDVADYAKAALPEEFSKERSPVYIDNTHLDGFLEGIMKRGCSPARCGRCGYCRRWAEKTVVLNERYRGEILAGAAALDHGIVSGDFWE